MKFTFVQQQKIFKFDFMKKKKKKKKKWISDFAFLLFNNLLVFFVIKFKFLKFKEFIKTNLFPYFFSSFFGFLSIFLRFSKLSTKLSQNISHLFIIRCHSCLFFSFLKALSAFVISLFPFGLVWLVYVYCRMRVWVRISCIRHLFNNLK